MLTLRSQLFTSYSLCLLQREEEEGVEVMTPFSDSPQNKADAGCGDIFSPKTDPANTDLGPQEEENPQEEGDVVVSDVSFDDLGRSSGETNMTSGGIASVKEELTKNKVKEANLEQMVADAKAEAGEAGAEVFTEAFAAKSPKAKEAALEAMSPSDRAAATKLMDLLEELTFVRQNLRRCEQTTARQERTNARSGSPPSPQGTKSPPGDLQQQWHNASHGERRKIRAEVASKEVIAARERVNSIYCVNNLQSSASTSLKWHCTADCIKCLLLLVLLITDRLKYTKGTRNVIMRWFRRAKRHSVQSRMMHLASDLNSRLPWLFWLLCVFDVPSASPFPSVSDCGLR